MTGILICFCRVSISTGAAEITEQETRYLPVINCFEQWWMSSNRRCTRPFLFSDEKYAYWSLASAAVEVPELWVGFGPFVKLFLAKVQKFACRNLDLHS